MNTVTTYDVPQDVRGEMHLTGFGLVAFAIEAGPFVPATPELEAVCSQLAANGLIKPASPKPTTQKKKAEPVATVDEIEE